MTEPLYEYVKGKGWVIHDNTTLTMRCGTVVRWERRMPESHERSRSFYSSRSLEECLEILKIKHFRDCHIGIRDVDYDSYEYQYFVLIPVWEQ